VIPTFLGAHEIPDEYRDAREDYIRLVIDEMLPLVASEGLARYCDVFCESHVFTVDESRRVLSRAIELGLGIRFHADQLSLSGGAALAAELGAASADHLEWIDAEGIIALKQSGVIAVLLPGAVFNLGLSRYAPARAMIEAGVAVAIASDFNPGSSPTPSMQMILSIACTQMRMTPSEAVTAATINAAYSLGCGGRLGLSGEASRLRHVRLSGLSSDPLSVRNQSCDGCDQVGPDGCRSPIITILKNALTATDRMI
jgi:imidazolonepropionase